jgi:hypothetical protein
VRPIAWFKGIAAFSTAAWFVHGALAADMTAQGTTRLTSEQVAVLASAAMRANGPKLKYEAKRPEFSADDGMWHVYFRQKGPIYMVDGDMIVVVNDRTGRACIGQMMMPPGPCT